MQPKVNQKSFNGQSIYAGIDVHKKSWKVTIMGEGQIEHKVMSQNPNPNLLASYLKRNYPGADYHAVYEAGFSGFEACRKLQQQGINCIVAHPADIPTTHKEKVQKSDKNDSLKLARSLLNSEFESIDIPTKKLEADRALIRQRFKMVKKIAAVKHQVKSLLFQFGIEIPERFSDQQSRSWSKSYINWLKELKFEEEPLKLVLDNYIRFGEYLRKELLLLTRQIRSLSRTEDYMKNYDLLVKIPGIGLITAMSFLVQLGDIIRFKSIDKLNNYIGLVPSMHGSGEKITTGKIIKRGRKDLRILLIEASWRAIQIDPVLKASYNELTKRMTGNKAIIRIARKILRRIRYVLTHQQEYILGMG